MSSIEEVRASEKKVQEALGALENAGAQDQNHLSNELRNATDEYARAVRELRLPRLRLRTCSICHEPVKIETTIRLAHLRTRLGQLLQHVMKETDPVKYDELGAEIWRVLREQERLTDQPSCFGQETG